MSSTSLMAAVSPERCASLAGRHEIALERQLRRLRRPGPKPWAAAKRGCPLGHERRRGSRRDGGEVPEG